MEESMFDLAYRLFLGATLICCWLLGWYCYFTDDIDMATFWIVVSIVMIELLRG